MGPSCSGWRRRHVAERTVSVRRDRARRSCSPRVRRDAIASRRCRIELRGAGQVPCHDARHHLPHALRGASHGSPLGMGHRRVNKSALQSTALFALHCHLRHDARVASDSSCADQPRVLHVCVRTALHACCALPHPQRTLRAPSTRRPAAAQSRGMTASARIGSQSARLGLCSAPVALCGVAGALCLSGADQCQHDHHSVFDVRSVGDVRLRQPGTPRPLSRVCMLQPPDRLRRVGVRPAPLAR
jgi:hypothetical protein